MTTSMSAEVRGHSRVFVDTNVLLYSFDTSAGVKRERALALVGRLWRQGNACISVQVLQEFYVNATRKLGKPLEPTVAKKVVASLARWEVHAPTADDVLNAITLQEEAQLSFWDAMIVTSAGRLGCRVLYSEDLNAGQRVAGVEVVNPFGLGGEDIGETP